MADESENQKPAEVPATEVPQEQAPAPQAETASANQTAAAPTEAPAAGEAAAPAKPAAKKTKKSPKKEGAAAPAAEAPKENLSLDPNEVEKPKIMRKSALAGLSHSGNSSMADAIAVIDPRMFEKSSNRPRRVVRISLPWIVFKTRLFTPMAAKNSA